jgi:hypothetical protein
MLSDCCRAQLTIDGLGLEYDRIAEALLSLLQLVRVSSDERDDALRSDTDCGDGHREESN